MLATLVKEDAPRSSAGALVPAKEARSLILRGVAPAGLRVHGALDLSGEKRLTALPAGLQALRIDVSGCTALEELPPGLCCFEINAKGSGLRALPPDLRVENRLDLSECRSLGALPAGLNVGSLVLQNCTALTALPEGLDVSFLDVTGCTSLCGWPEQAAVRVGRLVARDCSRLTTLPTWLTSLAQLDVSGCENLRHLPEGLRITSWLDIGGTGITSLPASLAGVRLRWRGVLVNERVVFHPETITGQEVLNAPNSEVRRVMLERMGYERFLNEVQAKVLDKDRDPGGERRLLRVPLRGDEDLVGLSVFCPSTGRQYILRVPPKTRTCHEAAAWIAGFDDPDDYRPLAET